MIELGTGSGAIAKAISDEAPGCTVIAVERDHRAAEWAAGDLAGTGVELIEGDMGQVSSNWDGRCDLVISNPPYIPLDAFESVEPEARDHDPELALFSGVDGLDAIRVVTATAARLLRPGGLLASEHSDLQGDAVVAILAGRGGSTSVRDHRDLAGRSRFTTAVRGRSSRHPSGRMVRVDEVRREQGPATAADEPLTRPETVDPREAGRDHRGRRSSRRRRRRDQMGPTQPTLPTAEDKTPTRRTRHRGDRFAPATVRRRPDPVPAPAAAAEDPVRVEDDTTTEDTVRIEDPATPDLPATADDSSTDDTVPVATPGCSRDCGRRPARDRRPRPRPR